MYENTTLVSLSELGLVEAIRDLCPIAEIRDPLIAREGQNCLLRRPQAEFIIQDSTLAYYLWYNNRPCSDPFLSGRVRERVQRSDLAIIPAASCHHAL